MIYYYYDFPITIGTTGTILDNEFIVTYVGKHGFTAQGIFKGIYRSLPVTTGGSIAFKNPQPSINPATNQPYTLDELRQDFPEYFI